MLVKFGLLSAATTSTTTILLSECYIIRLRVLCFCWLDFFSTFSIFQLFFFFLIFVSVFFFYHMVEIRYRCKQGSAEGMVWLIEWWLVDLIASLFDCFLDNPTPPLMLIGYLSDGIWVCVVVIAMDPMTQIRTRSARTSEFRKTHKNGAPPSCHMTIIFCSAACLDRKRGSISGTTACCLL